MTLAKQQLIRDIETLPEAKIERVAVFINALKATTDAVDVAALEAKFAEEDRQIAELAAQSDSRARMTLDELVALITDENRHAYIETGPPVGNEVW